MSDPFETRMLDPKTVSFARSSGGVLAAVIDGKEYPHITVTRTFPLTRPSEYISVSAPDGEEIGVIAQLDALNATSREAVLQELKYRYLVPVVTRIDKISQVPGLWTWDVQTDRGPMQLIMRNLHEHLQFVAKDRFLITDMDGRRCEVSNVDQLDVHSRRELRKIV